MPFSKNFASHSNKQSSLGLLPWLIGVALCACVLSLVLFNSIQEQSEAQRVKAEVRYTALAGWYEKFAERRANPLYLTGQ